MSNWYTVAPPDTPVEPFERNMTSNVNPMLRMAGFDPSEVDGMSVWALRTVVGNALEAMLRNPELYLPLEPANKWGSFAGTIDFLEELRSYLDKAPTSYRMKVT